MADNTSKTSLSNMTTKQKVIGAVVVIIFGFVIYEVIGLFSSPKPATMVMTPVPPQNAAAQQGQQARPMTAAMPAGAVAPSGIQHGGLPPGQQTGMLMTTNVLMSSPKDNADIQRQQQQQQVYLDSVNQLQLLKIKRDIAETNQAIATARLATETANKNMSDLLTQPTLPQAVGGTSITSTSISGAAVPTTIPTGNVVQTTETVQVKTQPVLDVPFVVISVSMQFNHWSAVLGYQDKLYSVATGDTLFDGSKVISINKSGVTLAKDGKRRRISIQSTI